MVARQGSAFCIYFMDHEPRDWHDLASNHDFARDMKEKKAGAKSDSAKGRGKVQLDARFDKTNRGDESTDDDR